MSVKIIKYYINKFARIESDCLYVQSWFKLLYKEHFVDQAVVSSSIGNHIKEQHGTVPSDIYRDFKILRKCQSKFDCLIIIIIGIITP